MNQELEERQPLHTPLSLSQIAEAFRRSFDAGATIVLSKLGLSDIGSREAEELACGKPLGSLQTGSVVERLALGSNRLSTLPPEFALFTKLRYLNLKHNLFTVFPEVLNLLPSLDTLDISHNRIKHLPSAPGNLVRLRVLCLSRNKLTRLPRYITQFENLEVLQIDRNPWQWPPMSLIENLTSIQHDESAGLRIRDLFTWMETDNQKVNYDDSGYSELTEWDHEPLWNFPLRSSHLDAGPTPHARTFSIDSNTSISSVTESLSGLDNGESQSNSALNHSGTFPPSQAELSHGVASECPDPQLPATYQERFGADHMHNRTQSHTTTLYARSQHDLAFGKKSLPDLWTGHGEAARDTETLLENKLIMESVPITNDPSIPSARQESAHLLAQFSSAKPEWSDDTLAFVPSDTVFKEGTSYFRRSSAVTMSYALPKPLRRLLECARSVLFATGQLYQALGNYKETDEQLPPILKRALQPAHGNLQDLIRSLDRFEDIGQTAIPSPLVCRKVVESCKDTVVAFRKAVILVSSQVNASSPPLDARSTRWLVLELYGISVELSTSWQAITPELEQLRPFLSGAVFSTTSNIGGGEFKFSTTLTHLVRDEIASIVRPRPVESLHSTLGPGRIRTARRHAGSFSSKDVEIGKDLPSYDVVPTMAAGVATRTPMLRTPKRLMTLPMTGPSTQHSYSPNLSSSPFAPTGVNHHLRSTSQGSLFDGPSLASLAISIDSPPVGILRSETQRAIRAAVDLTLIVCDQVAEALGDGVASNRNLMECLESARAIARKLSVDALDVLEGDFDKLDGRVLRESARSFLEAVLQLSNILQAHISPHTTTNMLKSNILRLVHHTEELSIMLHASYSVSDTPTGSPTFSPRFAAYSAYPQRMEDYQLGSNFSRSRPTQSKPASSKQSITAPSDLALSSSPLPVKPLNTRKLPVKDAFEGDLVVG